MTVLIAYVYDPDRGQYVINFRIITLSQRMERSGRTTEDLGRRLCFNTMIIKMSLLQPVFGLEKKSKVENGHCYMG